MYLLSFLVPEAYVDAVKEAIFAVGAGSIDHYQYCAWQTLGQGQFMPLMGSDAFIGEVNQLETLPEYKVEIMCSKEQIKKAVQALKTAHPYETPAYQVLKCEDF